MSDQLKPEIDTDYGILHKCYSIWLCFDTLGNDNSTVAGEYHYKMHCSQAPKGNYSEKDELNTDLLELIVLRTGGPNKVDDTLLSFINALFRDNDNLDQYLEGLPENTEIIEEASDMCDIRKASYNAGVQDTKLHSAVSTVVNGLKQNLPLDLISKLIDGTLSEDVLVQIKELYLLYSPEEIIKKLESKSNAGGVHRERGAFTPVGVYAGIDRAACEALLGQG